MGAAARLATLTRPDDRSAHRRAAGGAAAALPARTAASLRPWASEMPVSRSEATRSVTLPTLVEAPPRPTARQPRRPSPRSAVLEERVGTIRKALGAVGNLRSGGRSQRRRLWRLARAAPTAPCDATAQRRATACEHPSLRSTGQVAVVPISLAHDTTPAARWRFSGLLEASRRFPASSPPVGRCERRRATV